MPRTDVTVERGDLRLPRCQTLRAEGRFGGGLDGLVVISQVCVDGSECAWRCVEPTARSSRHLVALVLGGGPLVLAPATAGAVRTATTGGGPTKIAVDRVAFDRSFQVRIDRAGAAVHTLSGAQWESPNHDGVTTKNWPIA